MSDKNPEGITRRQFLKGAGLAAVGLGLGAKAVESAAQNIGIFETDAQKKAKEIFSETQEKDFFRLVVGPEGANYRNVASADPEAGNNPLGKLNPNEVVERAIIWHGTGAEGQGSIRELWYAFPEPKTAERIVFSYSGNFKEIVARIPQPKK